MPSLNLDLNFFDHPKVKRLRAAIGPEAEIYLLRLWAYAGRFHAATGNLKGYTSAEIEALAEWKGESGKMLQAMLRVGFLEPGNKIHDWREHEGHLIIFKERAQQAAATRWGNRINKESKQKHKTSNASSSATSNALAVHCSSLQSKALTTTTAPGKPDAEAGKKPVNWDNCRTDLQKVISTYVRVGNTHLYAPGSCTQAQATAIFKVQGKPAAAILAQCGDAPTACRVVELAAKYYQSKGLDWSLYAVSKSCPDYLNQIAKEKNYVKG